MREDPRPVTNAVKALLQELREGAEDMRAYGLARGYDPPVIGGRLPAGDVPAEVLWIGSPSYRWWHSPLLAFDFLAFSMSALLMAPGSVFFFSKGSFFPGVLLALLAAMTGLGSVYELLQGYSDLRKRHYVLTRCSLKEHSITSMSGASLWAITRIGLRRHRDGTGTISYWTRHGDEYNLLRLEDAEVVYLMLWEYVEAARQNKESVCE